MRNRIIWIFAVIFCAAALCGCAKAPSPDDKALAKISNKTITLGYFKKKLSKLPAYYKDIVAKNKKKYLDDTIVETMFYEEAIRQSLDKDREVKDVLDEARKKILIAKLIKTEVEDKIKIHEAEVKDYYDSHKEEYKSPEMWRASHILVQTEDRAREALDKLSSGADFAELAASMSTDATSGRGGDVGYFRKAQVVPEFEEACMKLEIGQVSGIVHSRFGYHIIKLTDKKEPAIEPYDGARRMIEEALKKKKRSELFDELVLSLKSKYGVKIEDDVFKTLEGLDIPKDEAK